MAVGAAAWDAFYQRVQALGGHVRFIETLGKELVANRALEIRIHLNSVCWTCVLVRRMSIDR